MVGSLRSNPDTWEVGHLAVWSVTTAKPANGVDALRDGREDTYWQSDGMQPHLINIHFQKKVGQVARQAPLRHPYGRSRRAVERCARALPSRHRRPAPPAASGLVLYPPTRWRAVARQHASCPSG